MFGKIGSTEIIVVLAIVLVVFGPTQLPKLTKMLGKSIKGFKDGLGEEETNNKTDGE